MDFAQLGPEAEGWLREALGYLNFSSGAADPKFLRAINGLFGRLLEMDGGGSRRGGGCAASWRRVWRSFAAAATPSATWIRPPLS